MAARGSLAIAFRLKAPPFDTPDATSAELQAAAARRPTDTVRLVFRSHAALELVRACACACVG